MSTTYKPIIGIEIHTELSTVTKMFCGCPADHFGKSPNTQTCPVCLGLPGALPVPNKKAVDWTLMIGKALACQINSLSKFDRKHYFYPDLPKGFQTSQFDQPFSETGKLEIIDHQKTKTINITRVHLEEDTGKLKHVTLDGEKVSLVDFNRSGVPLVEIVSEPDIFSSSEAVSYAKSIQQIVRFLGVSDADMEKGTMRLEANISLQKQGETKLPPYKVEVKNINSFKYLKAAIDYEVVRHTDLLTQGQTPDQETRGWNERMNATISQRSKETSKDYRYFPEPDIPPMRFSEKYLSSLFSHIPPLPIHYQKNLSLLGIRPDYIETLTATPELAVWSQEVVKEAKLDKLPADKLANFMVNQKISPRSHKPKKVIELYKQSISKSKVSADQLQDWVVQVIQDNPDIVNKYHQGKKSVIGALIGQVMKLSKGQADPKQIQQLLIKSLEA